MKHLVVGDRQMADDWAKANGVPRKDVIAATEPGRVYSLHENIAVIPNPMWLMRHRGTKIGFDVIDAIQRARFLQMVYGRA